MESIGNVIQQFLKDSKWAQRINSIRIVEEWEKIAGTTIAKHTYNVKLTNGKLFLNTDIGPLKQELAINKQKFINNINDYFKEVIVYDIIVR